MVSAMPDLWLPYWLKITASCPVCISNFTWGAGYHGLTYIIRDVEIIMHMSLILSTTTKIIDSLFCVIFYLFKQNFL